jgi:5,10-methylenetetrahydrofolate reductase
MEIIAEVTPVRDREKLLKKLEALKPLVDWIDIPEAPGGKPTAHSLAVGALAKQMGFEPIVHIRLLDVNKTGLKSLLGGVYILDIKHVVLLQGDPPAEGQPVREVSTEEAVEEAKKLGLKAGALLSLRRNYKKTRGDSRSRFLLSSAFHRCKTARRTPPNSLSICNNRDEQ